MEEDAAVGLGKRFVGSLFPYQIPHHLSHLPPHLTLSLFFTTPYLFPPYAFTCPQLRKQLYKHPPPPQPLPLSLSKHITHKQDEQESGALLFHFAIRYSQPVSFAHDSLVYHILAIDPVSGGENSTAVRNQRLAVTTETQWW